MSVLEGIIEAHINERRAAGQHFRCERLERADIGEAPGAGPAFVLRVPHPEEGRRDLVFGQP